MLAQVIISLTDFSLHPDQIMSVVPVLWQSQFCLSVFWEPAHTWKALRNDIYIEFRGFVGYICQLLMSFLQ